MGISIIVAVLAMLVALAALWFVNDVLQKVETQTTTFLENSVRPLQDRLEELQKSQSDLLSRLRDAEKKADGGQAAAKELAGRIKAVAEATENLSRKLDDLDKSILPRYKQPKRSEKSSDFV